MVATRGGRLERLLFMIYLVASCGGTGFSVEASADELHTFYRGVRAQAMGGAYVAVADDEEALFLNPAGLAGLSDRSLHYMSLDIDGAQDILTTYLENASALSGLSINTINQLMGKNLYARGTFTPSFVIPNFAIGAIFDAQTSVSVKNQALPTINVGYQYLYGIQVATGLSFKFGSRSTRRKRSVLGELRLGVGAKVLWKRGGYRTLPMDFLLNADQALPILNQIAWPWGMGYGLDLGAMWVMNPTSNVRLALGAAFINAGDVTYSPAGPDKEKGNLSAGASIRIGDDSTNILVAYEQQHIQEDVDFRLKQHLGVELKASNLSIFGGMHQTSLTFGAAFDVWLFRLTAASYAQELGAQALLDSSRRYMLRIDMKMPM